MDGVEVAELKDKGRGVIAVRDFNEGDVVLECEPFVTLLSIREREARCGYCWSVLTSVNRCSSCRVTCYCSRECQKSGWKCHKYECKLLQRGARHLDDTDLLATVARRLMTKDGNRDSAMSSAVLQLAGCDSDSSGEIPSKDVFDKAMMQNNFEMMDSYWNSVGLGVFPIGSLLNHDCNPSVVISYDLDSKRQTFRAIRPIKKGEEVCHSYVDTINTLSQRRGALFQRYGFECACTTCLSDQHGSRAETDKERVTEKDGERVEGVLSSLEMARRSGSLQKLEDAHKQLTECLGPRHLSILCCLADLLPLYIEGGNTERAIWACKAIIQFYKHYYPEHHPLLGLQYWTLADLYGSRGEDSLRKDAACEALRILTVCCGHQSPNCVQLRQSLSTSL